MANWLGSRQDMVLGKVKEPRYFTDFSDFSWRGPGIKGFSHTLIHSKDQYLSNFCGKESAIWAIDASTDLIWCDVSAGKIKDFSREVPVKIICITRDPIQRAISEYNHTLSADMEDLSFKESLLAEDERRIAGWQPLFFHQRRSRVNDDINRYRELFGDDLLILEYGALRDSGSVNQIISNFLNVDLIEFNDVSSYNRRKIPRNRASAIVLRQQVITNIGRKIFTKRMRFYLRSRLEGWSSEINTVSKKEILFCRDLLLDEIEACKKNPLIDTSSWAPL